MRSLTAFTPHLLFSHYSFAGFSCSLFSSVFLRFPALNLVAVKEAGSLQVCFDSLKRGNRRKGLYWGCSGLFLRRCKDWDSEGDFSLEEEILEFMKNSSNPDAFPTKKQLVDSGRMDLADAIVKKGGWLAFGWDLGEETQERFGEMDAEDGSSEIDGNEIWGCGFPSSSSANCSQPAMSTGRSVEIEAEESGIEGILSRLEKERNNSFGLGFKEEEDTISIGNYEDKDKWHQRTARDVMLKFLPVKLPKGVVSNISGNDILEITDFAPETINKEEGLCFLDGRANYNDIKGCIWQLESELSSVLHLLRSCADKVAIQTENEIRNAQDRLRSIRAKMPVLEGKMAEAIMDSHKIVEKKQKRIDYTHRALRLLKTACVVWPNTGSEVLLAGSFDGWSTQRQMEKSSTGTFSVSLQLYPGKYEIKFIVDGEWKIDPLRPIVHNDNGYENNLLIIRD